MKSYGKLTWGLLIAWFVFALSSSALHLFKNGSNRIGLAVALAAATPIVVFLLWFAASTRFRQFTLSLNPRLLTAAHTWRIVGFTLVLLEATASCQPDSRCPPDMATSQVHQFGEGHGPSNLLWTVAHRLLPGICARRVAAWCANPTLCLGPKARGQDDRGYGSSERGQRFHFAGDDTWRQVVGVVKNGNYSTPGE